jgi:hypothetical protein
VAELQRLIPGDWGWKVEEAGLNSFRTVFPNLIPSSVNVVISENLYELKFWVELATEASNP